MAKIYDFKSKQLIVELPYQPTDPYQPDVYEPLSPDHPKGLVDHWCIFPHSAEGFIQAVESTGESWNEFLIRNAKRSA